MVSRRMSTSYDYYKSDEEGPDDKSDQTNERVGW